MERWAGGAPGHPMGTSGPVRQLDSDGGLCLLGADSKYLGTCLLEILCRVASKSMMPCNSTSELDESVNRDGWADRIVTHLWFWTLNVVLPLGFRSQQLIETRNQPWSGFA